MLLKEIKNIFHRDLDTIYPKEEVDSFFYLLIEHFLGLKRFVLAIQPHLVITKEEEQPLFEALTELRRHRPIQYIIGTAHFMGLDFKVDDNVLIPRPETEELVRWMLADLMCIAGKPNTNKTRGPGKKRTGASAKDGACESSIPEGKVSRKGPVIMDIGTGSGCIAISLAKNLPEAKVHALDVSTKALAVAQENAVSHDVAIEFITADILDMNILDRAIPEEVDISEEDVLKAEISTGHTWRTYFDAVASNPPYVRLQERKDMHKNVTDHEPELALFVSDKDPLEYYEAIARFGQRNLKENGKLYLEINQYLAEETKALLKDHNFSEIELRKDGFGNYRMIKCKKVTQEYISPDYHT
ncbi:MAG TPA: peptide chain release factor N(5)-glutamine methyltransferase [Pricia sp.]|nr:peptide chain release factor N(5)-glutamine methyltransferase [Pricia sp.]